MTDITQFDLFDLPMDDADETEEIAFQEAAISAHKKQADLKLTAQKAKGSAAGLSEAKSETIKMPEALDAIATLAAVPDISEIQNHDLTLLMAELLAAKPLFSKNPAQLSAAFKDFLQALVSMRYLSYVDGYFAEFLTQQKGFKKAEDHLGYWLLALFVSRAYGLGHTALPYDYLTVADNWFIESDRADRPQVIEMLLEIVFDIPSHVEKAARDAQLQRAWAAILPNLSLPLVMTNHGIYLERNYAQESVIVDLFKSIKEMPVTDQEMHYLSDRLNHYFNNPQEPLDWQKFAAANVILNHISVISGGPGTGKTTTVFKILQTLIDLHHYRAVSDNPKPFTILLAAPTGKAAARLSESILGQMRSLQQRVEDAPIEVQEAVRQQLSFIPHVGQTLHRLLVIHPFTRKPRYNRYNPLNFDLLVVDEASMIDQQMLVQLIGALPDHGRVIFLGDKDQLASVEAGAIMHELCIFENYSQQHFLKLQQLLMQPLPEAALVNTQMPAFNYLSFLKRSYRFSADSALGQLAKIVNNEQGQPLDAQFKAMMALIANDEAMSEIDKSLAYTPLPMAEASLKKSLQRAFKPYVDFLKRGEGIEFAQAAFNVFSQLGVLSARRTGINGAVELNILIRQTLFPKEFHREFFHGLPIMVTHNSVENNLFNGDIGLILRNEAGQLRAYFEGVDSARVFSIHALPKFETAFAMTIHKSQGSEFQKIMLFLGEDASVFLTKELFYTGITRARESVHIFANDASIKAALSGRVDRFSFIHQRLRE